MSEHRKDEAPDDRVFRAITGHKAAIRKLETVKRQRRKTRGKNMLMDYYFQCAAERTAKENEEFAFATMAVMTPQTAKGLLAYPFHLKEIYQSRELGKLPPLIMDSIFKTMLKSASHLAKRGDAS